MVPWVFIYGINCLVLFAAAIILFFNLGSGNKPLGLLPLFWGLTVLLGQIAVIFFIIEQVSAKRKKRNTFDA